LTFEVLEFLFSLFGHLLGFTFEVLEFLFSLVGHLLGFTFDFCELGFGGGFELGENIHNACGSFVRCWLKSGGNSFGISHCGLGLGFTFSSDLLGLSFEFFLVGEFTLLEEFWCG